MSVRPRGVESLAARGQARRRVPAVVVAGSAAALIAALTLGTAGASAQTAASAQTVRSAQTVAPLGYDPADLGSLSSITQIVGAQSAWTLGYTGAGVDVAVIDTGVARVPGLAEPGKVVTGPDLSFDSQNGWPAGVDAYGHGTFMAGLIAGRDAGVSASADGCTTCLNSSGYSDTTKFVGVAPQARIVNVKVGAADGAVDVTQVIAAVDWVTQHAHDPGLNIRVLSLSYGTDSSQPYTIDPLAQAIEQAWKHGIVVVAAAGNDGKKSKQLADPGYDPYVIAAGADDPLGTLAVQDDTVPAFAQHGNTKRPVDVTAPATHVIGLRVPGSFIDTRLDNTGQVGTRFQRGSGTSQATAIVAGAAALVVQQYPNATPDQVKGLLNGTATKLASGNANAPGQRVHWGYGIVNAFAATLSAPASVTQTAEVSTGAGTLDAARGGVTVTNGTQALTGQRDIFGQPFNSTAMAAAQTTATAWNGGIWNGSRWTGDGWANSGADGGADSGVDGGWTGSRWRDNDWSGGAWTGSRWRDTTWDGSRWRGGWGGSQWTGTGWDDARWASYNWG